MRAHAPFLYEMHDPGDTAGALYNNPLDIVSQKNYHHGWTCGCTHRRAGVCKLLKMVQQITTHIIVYLQKSTYT